jgi:serine phosphatase RsbU (regulator of sigma subunit)
VHIYRAATASVETLSSTGLWLGLKDDISSALAVQEFRLQPGDQLLLHTDGVTEATRDGTMFDVQGLRRVLGSAGTQSAQHVLSEIFAALGDYRVADDATIVVLKQLGALEAKSA